MDSVSGAKLRKPAVLVAYLLASCMAVAEPSMAQTVPARRVEFDEAVREALVKNPDIGQAAILLLRADALVQQARALTVPSITAGLTNTTLDSARGFSGGTTQPQNQFAFSANARYDVGGWIDVGHARDQTLVATASVAEVRQRVAVAAAQAYLAIIGSRRQVEVNERAVEVARSHLDYATKRLEGGAGTRLNQLRAMQAVTGNQLQVENAYLALRRAQEALGLVMAADGPIDAGAEPSFAVPSFGDDSSSMATRVDLKTQIAVRQAAEHIVRDNWMDWMPLPSLSFDPLVVTPNGLFQPSRTWRFTVSMTQPLFDGGQRRATLRLRQAAFTEATLAVSETELKARSEVRIAREALASLERALATARAAVAQASDVLGITTAAFEVGATTNIEVIDAQRVVRDAESTTAGVEDAVRRARLDLLIALGRFPN